jgi:hypothetical protein
MNNWTILNITNNKAKFNFVYMFTMFVISGFAYLMVFWYRQKYESYRSKTDPKLQEFDDIDVARYSLFVKNLPTNVGVEEL